MNRATIIITPRDRYTGIKQCVETVYDCTQEPIDLLVLDLGYPSRLLAETRQALAGHPNAEIVPLGRIIPMEAFARVRERIGTPYTVFLDNDSRVTPGWLPPLLQAAEAGAAVVTPLTLEREGLDKGASLRNHIYTSELRVADVAGTPYLIEHKSFRREVPERIPKAPAPTDLFELHCVLFETAVLQSIDLPPMVIREHIDMAMQVHALGRRLMAEPRSVVIFDNLNQRMSLPDIRFFFYRWSGKLATRSSRLFEQRWGYNFYAERFMMNWIVRRKAYLLARYLGLPSAAANRVAGAVNRLFLRDWDPLKDPIGQSQRLYDALPSGMPIRRDRQQAQPKASALAAA